MIDAKQAQKLLDTIVSLEISKKHILDGTNRSSNIFRAKDLKWTVEELERRQLEELTSMIGVAKRNLKRLLTTT